MRLFGKCILVLLMVTGMNIAVESVQAEPHDKLVPLLINLDGWDSEAGKGMSMAAGPMKMITAHRNYKQGTKLIDVNVMVNSGPPPASKMKDSVEEVGDISIKTKMIDEFWVSSSHNKKNNTGQVFVTLAYNKDAHALLSLSYSDLNDNEAIDIAKKFKWKALEKTTGKML